MDTVSKIEKFSPADVTSIEPISLVIASGSVCPGEEVIMSVTEIGSMSDSVDASVGFGADELSLGLRGCEHNRHQYKNVLHLDLVTKRKLVRMKRNVLHLDLMTNRNLVRKNKMYCFRI